MPDAPGSRPVGSRLLAAIVTEQTKPSGRNSVVMLPSREAPIRSNTTWPKPLWVGSATRGPPCSCQITLAPFAASCVQLIDTEPAELESAPCLVALVASSCTTSPNDCIADGVN